MLQQAKNFLELILPPTGIFCAIHFVPAGPKPIATHEWYGSAQEVADRVLFWSSKGFDTYHACASYSEAGAAYKGRSQAKVEAIRSFWLDIDCGLQKDYSDQRAAALALGQFCQATKLPMPTIVSSGRGLHVYWPLATALDGATWRKHAQVLKALVAQHGLKVDTSRTSDQASILRTPGTHNY